MPKGGKLTPKQQAFVIAFLGKARGNAAMAARLAGFGRTAASAAQLGWRTLQNVHVQRAIVERRTVREKRQQLEDEHIDAILADVAQREDADLTNRLRALDLLNKSRGRYSSTLNLRGAVTLEQLAEASRATEPQPAAKTKD